MHVNVKLNSITPIELLNNPGRYKRATFLVQGDLKRLLRSGAMPLTLAQRLVICHQAALAVAHCASCQLVHGDIAARNFLVSRSFDVKLSNVAAARGVDADDYCELGGRLVPLRWLAPETALAGNSSTCSDIWSYAVFVVEVGMHALAMNEIKIDI
jgi:serine/threonine protein kinase